MSNSQSERLEHPEGRTARYLFVLGISHPNRMKPKEAISGFLAGDPHVPECSCVLLILRIGISSTPNPLVPATFVPSRLSVIDCS